MKKSILLPIVAIIMAAAILFGLNFGLASYRADLEAQELTAKMQTILPGSEVFTEEEYTGEDTNIVATYKAENGYVVETSTYGYAGDINMYIGVSNAGSVTGLVVNTMSETPGLGGEALTDHVFLSQFLNKSGTFTVVTGGVDAFSAATGESTGTTGQEQEVDAITGATVTSKAVARSVSSAVGYVTGADVTSSATTWGG